MKSKLWTIALWFRSHIKHPIRIIKDTARFIKDFKCYNSLNRRKSFEAILKNIWPIADWDNTASDLSYYFWQDLWAAKKIYKAKPEAHFDVASRVDGFVAHLLTFMPVTVMDVRPLPWKVEGLNFIQADATNLEGIEDNSIQSLSSLCALEHFGLGRYGEPVDPEACFNAMRSMQRVLRVGGHLYLAVPVGRDGVSFNAARVFSPETVISTLDKLTLVDFTVVDNRTSKVYYREHLSLDQFHHDYDSDFQKDYGYWTSFDGLFEFVKK